VEAVKTGILPLMCFCRLCTAGARPVGWSEGACRRGRPVSQQDRGRTGRRGLQHLYWQHRSRWSRCRRRWTTS